MLNKFYKWLDTPPIVRIMRVINGEPPPLPPKKKAIVTRPRTHLEERRRAIAELEKQLAVQNAAKPRRKGK